MLSHDKADRVASLNGAAKRVHIPDPRLIHAGPGYLLFRLNAAERPMWIRSGGERLQSLQIPWPALIVLAAKVGSSRSLRVFAMRANQRPQPSTALFHAPLLNTDTRGVVNIGERSHPRGLQERHIDEWVEALTGCVFTHNQNPFALDLGREPIATHTHIHALRKLDQRGGNRFPVDWLRAYGTTLGELHV